MKMRVVHLSTAHTAEDIRIYLKQCRTLAAAGYDVHWVVTAPRDEIRDGIHIHALPQRGGRFYRMVAKQVLAFRRVLALKPDIVHFHDPELLFCGLVFRMMGVRVVYDAHEDLPRQINYKNWIAPALRKPLAAVIEVIEDALARRLSAVVGATPHIAARFAKINPDTVCVSNYPLLSELAVLTGAEWEKREKSVVYAGNISPERGAREMLEAAKISGVKINVAGNASPADIETAMRAADAKGEIAYYGHVSRERVLHLMQTMRAGLVCFHDLPNHTEAQPNKLFEYMGAGLPVIASHFPLWRSMIETENCGICVDPSDPRQIADAITRILADADAAKAMGERGQHAVKNTYNWENESKALLALYDRLQKN